MLNKDVMILLDKWDIGPKPFTSFNEEFKIASQIKELLQSNDDYHPTFEDITEQATFSFVENYSNDESGWGTYHGPMFVLPNEEGQMVEFPSIQKIEDNTIDYWITRANDTKNPVMAYRYANLVVDFSKKIRKKGSSIDMIHLTIDSAISLCKMKLATPLDCKTKIKRALILAIRINDKSRIENVKNSIIQLEERVAEDKSAGLWGFSAKWLLLDFYDKVILIESESSKLVQDLEIRLERIKNDPWKAEHAITLLAEYYAKHNTEDDLIRILNVFEQSLKSHKRTNSTALLKFNAYDHLIQIYDQYSRFPKADAASKRLRLEISSLDLDWSDSMKTISVETEISHDKIKEHIESIFGTNDEKSLLQVMSALAVAHLPKQEFLEQQFDEFTQNHPLQYHVTNQFISDDGLMIAKLSSGTSDRQRHLSRHARQSIEIGSFFLSHSIDELKKKYTLSTIVEHFRQSILFQQENPDYLSRALTEYYNGDYLIASHLFCPIIESAIRECIRKAGGQTLKINNLGGYDQVLLGGLLNNVELFNLIFGELGNNVQYYFKIVLIDKLGFNLRNDFAHGIGKKKFFYRNTSDVLFHVMIWLSLVVTEKTVASNK